MYLVIPYTYQSEVCYVVVCDKTSVSVTQNLAKGKGDIGSKI